MQTVTATEAKNQLAEVMQAAVKEPVMIERNGKPYVVMMSAEAWEGANRKHQVEEFLSLCDDMAKAARNKGMTKEILEAILRGED